MNEIVFTDRYQALGIEYPDPATVCQGQCEGTGWVPVSLPEQDERLGKLWLAAHATAHTLRKRIKNAVTFRDIKCLFEKCDGWHFVRCPECEGTGKRQS